MVLTGILWSAAEANIIFSNVGVPVVPSSAVFSVILFRHLPGCPSGKEEVFMSIMAVGVLSNQNVTAPADACFNIDLNNKTAVTDNQLCKKNATSIDIFEVFLRCYITIIVFDPVDFYLDAVVLHVELLARKRSSCSTSIMLGEHVPPHVDVNPPGSGGKAVLLPVARR